MVEGANECNGLTPETVVTTISDPSKTGVKISESAGVPPFRRDPARVKWRYKKVMESTRNTP